MIPIKRELSIPARASTKYASLSIKEQKKGWRIIGGERGDLYFDGFSVADKKTVVSNPHLKYFGIDELPEDEAAEIAEAILMFSFEAIGVETVEHS